MSHLGDVPRGIKPDGLVAYTSVGLLSLPSNRNRAMREASIRRTATDTDSYAFFVYKPTANEGRTEAKITICVKVYAE